MQCGFLNTPQYKRAIEEEPENDTNTMLPPEKKGKGKPEGMHDDDMNSSPYGPLVTSDHVNLTRFPPNSGRGRHATEAFLHTVPESLQDKDGSPYRKRAIFRFWPRPPDGKPIIPTGKPEGTLSPDGYSWGATLYDFYAVNRLPGCGNAISYMTGSALLQAMRTLGELDVAKAEIEWAISEGKPRDEGVADTEELIKCTENWIKMSRGSRGGVVDEVAENVKEEKHGGEETEGVAPKNDKENSNDEDYEVDEVDEDAGIEGAKESGIGSDDMEVDHAAIPPPPTIPLTSPFHPTHYPKPWPLGPFEERASVLLQERIPLYLLPSTLYVHDPFDVLSAYKQDFHNTSWNSRPDVIQTYNLELYSAAHRDREAAKKKAEELEEFKAHTLIVLRYKRTEEQIKNHEPVIEVPLLPPRHMTKTDESHLYLSPTAIVGEGHHSIVYEAECELPRDLFARPKICAGCFKDSVDKEMARLKDTGRWAELLRAPAYGSTDQPTETTLDGVSHPGREVFEWKIVCIVPHTATPSQTLEAINKNNIWDMMREKDRKTAVLDFTGGSSEDESTEGSDVAIVRINPPFSYEQNACAHGLDRSSIPRTAKFTVIAKLSLQGDHHLAREAKNYQRFPERFSHHYDGYTINPQLRAVVPVHAIIPQFYGYYMPDQRDGENSYLSPILLLEHCGKPIEPEALSVEDQEECASMVLRFQRAGWLHESLAPRNFLVQERKPTELPKHRQVPPELSFRLIDFGRSRKWEKATEKMEEEREALKMFEKLDVANIPITLSI